MRRGKRLCPSADGAHRRARMDVQAGEENEAPGLGRVARTWSFESTKCRIAGVKIGPEASNCHSTRLVVGYAATASENQVGRHGDPLSEGSTSVGAPSAQA